MTVPASDWLSQGGAYAVVFIQTVLIMGVGVYLAMSIGKSAKAEGDGCLLAMANIVLAALGAGIGFFSSQYPFFVLTSLIGACILPTAATAIFASRIRKASAKIERPSDKES